MKLPREFYLRDGLTVARELIGKKLVTNLRDGLTSGIIVETEAYMGKLDAAAHSYRGLTERTKIFYGAGGFVYVYLIYGRNLCTNVVANVENVPEAVLIRALEPVDGIELMKIRRGKQPALKAGEQLVLPETISQTENYRRNFYRGDGRSSSGCGDEANQRRLRATILRDLCSGPGKLSQALGVTKDFYGADLCSDEIFIEATDVQVQIAATKRINVDYAGEAANYPWRFVAAGNKFLSVK